MEDKYLCPHCDEYFDLTELEVYEKYNSLWGDIEQFVICPYCGDFVVVGIRMEWDFSDEV